jgi:preprotein translocase subunit SecE
VIAMDEDEREQPRFLTMVGIVAFVVAITILVFFGIGYLFGRLFL